MPPGSLLAFAVQSRADARGTRSDLRLTPSLSLFKEMHVCWGVSGHPRSLVREMHVGWGVSGQQPTGWFACASVLPSGAAHFGRIQIESGTESTGTPVVCTAKAHLDHISAPHLPCQEELKAQRQRREDGVDLHSNDRQECELSDPKAGQCPHNDSSRTDKR